MSTDKISSFYIDKNLFSPMTILIFKLILLIFIIGILFFYVLFEEDTLIDSFYNTAVTLTTLGATYTSETETEFQRFFIAIYSIISTILFFIFISTLAVDFYEYHKHHILKKIN